MPDGGLLAVLLLAGLVAPFVLYALIRAEHDQRESMPRDAAERTARQDTSDEK